jgi:hypothetical protein
MRDEHQKGRPIRPWEIAWFAVWLMAVTLLVDLMTR